ncbi:hypothetical protein CH330_06750 [candidate division WOR-3 bacterium JGI_Cruoil_03_51_56]|uniref:Uncharacterized protein n=1 Tax=candidate division WOR-3 bacterium JGI_Cruoil_03_51_56 TaxID=1973747 RepID=A0A235BS68_UNCW3|nr:MAG: hypothetical protein CH330_06750 [candidate division WOR-3 bacterium JGI_Cruoil_03_51_56]
MLKRSIALALLGAVIALFPGCSKETKVIGTLALQPGQTGDVQNTRVSLYENANLTGKPVVSVTSEASGDPNSSPFEFTDVIQGDYYLLAWKDLDGDSAISDKDLGGVYGGTCTPGYGGKPITVAKGQTNDVGTIEMLVYKELKITASGVRTNGNTVTDLSYSFNYDVVLTSLTIAWPDGGQNRDLEAPGAKTAGTVYHSIWNVGGAEMPTGEHNMNFTGSWNGTAFDVDVPVQVN